MVTLNAGVVGEITLSESWLFALLSALGLVHGTTLVLEALWWLGSP